MPLAAYKVRGIQCKFVYSVFLSKLKQEGLAQIRSLIVQAGLAQLETGVSLSNSGNGYEVAV